MSYSITFIFRLNVSLTSSAIVDFKFNSSSTYVGFYSGVSVVNEPKCGLIISF